MRRRLMLQKGVDANTLLLLHAEDFTDTAGNITLSNTNVTIDSSGKFNKCFYFNGRSWFKSTSTPLFAFGLNDFTIEYWIKPTNSSSTQGLVCTNRNWNTGNGIYNGITSGCKIQFYSYQNNTSNGICECVLQINTWQHVAYVVKNGVANLYLNGVLQASNTMNVYIQCNYFHIGIENETNNAGPYYGYLDEIRISNIARYSSNFTPPTKPF